MFYGEGYKKKGSLFDTADTSKNSSSFKDS
jgi:hypothetical protein